jgi:2-oxoglutarate dehydrogenase E1 component
LKKNGKSFAKSAKPEDFDQSPDTSITQTSVDKVGKALTTIPEGFKPLKQIEKLLKDRKEAFFEKKMLGWAEAELLAYGSLLSEGIMCACRVRM